jgi:hypothetical protein
MFYAYFVTAGKNISDNVPPSNRTPESYFHPMEDPPPEFNLSMPHTSLTLLNHFLINKVLILMV